MTKSPDMITAFGHEVRYDKPEQTTVDPEDLRVHSSNICRYSGAINWKLIKHLALVVKLVDLYYDKNPVHRAYAAAHDLHEIYCTDVVSGLKAYLPIYKKIEDSFEEHVHETLGLPWGLKDVDVIHFVDRRALIIEMAYHNHPGMEVALKKFKNTPFYGRPTAAEMKIIHQVHKMSPNRCWDLVWRAVVTGREVIKQTEMNETEAFTWE
jgi:hypothetical protein